MGPWTTIFGQSQQDFAFRQLPTRVAGPGYNFLVKTAYCLEKQSGVADKFKGALSCKGNNFVPKKARESVAIQIDNQVAASYLKKQGRRIQALDEIIRPRLLWAAQKEFKL